MVAKRRRWHKVRLNFQRDHFGWEWRKKITFDFLYIRARKMKNSPRMVSLWSAHNKLEHIEYELDIKISKKKKLRVKEKKANSFLMMRWNKAIEWHDVACSLCKYVSLSLSLFLLCEGSWSFDKNTDSLNWYSRGYDGDEGTTEIIFRLTMSKHFCWLRWKRVGDGFAWKFAASLPSSMVIQT